jgi:hypothetical protein
MKNRDSDDDGDQDGMPLWWSGARKTQ